MALTPAQLATLKADIAADGTLNPQPKTMDGAITVAAAYNAEASPDYWVWQTSVTQDTITQQASVDGTVWSWPALIARSAGEIAGWQGIMGGTNSCNPSLVNVRQGFADIFSGSANSAPAQRAHLMTICRRKATRFEKLFATTSAAPPATSGALGATTNVATMTVEGPLSAADVYAARLLP
jgi:hypothetical protein